MTVVFLMTVSTAVYRLVLGGMCVVD